MDPRIATSDLKKTLGVSAVDLGSVKVLGTSKCCSILNKDAVCPFKKEAHSSPCLYLVENEEGRVTLKCHGKKDGCDKKYKQILSRRPQGFNFVGLGIEEKSKAIGDKK